MVSADRWNPALIDRAEVMERTEGWPLTLCAREDGSIHMVCGKCSQSTARLSQNGAWEFTTGELVIAVLRHMVMAHDEPLGRHRGQR